MKSVPLILITVVLTLASRLLFIDTAQAAPQRLLPFQGRLTVANGTPVSDGAKVVQFKIYDSPTGGTAVWSGEVQKLTVNGGLVSTLLGSKVDLAGVDFNQAIYLKIIVDANADSQINAADPPLLPRQSILPAVFVIEAQTARDSKKLAGFDWSAVFNNGNPTTGNIPANRVSFPTGSLPASVVAPNNSITEAQLAPNAVNTGEIKDIAVTQAKFADGAVGTAQIIDGTIVNSKIALNTIQPNQILRNIGFSSSTFLQITGLTHFEIGDGECRGSHRRAANRLAPLS